jgi:signal transduction histidine kinase
MIVDDDSANRSILGEILGGGYELCSVATGMEALSAVDAFEPDLILLDIMMPEIDGYEVCRRLKARPLTADIPVLFLSAKTEPDDKIAAFAAGGVDYITKPFDLEEVIARVNVHLELVKAKREIRHHNEQLEQMLRARTRELVISERRAAFSLMAQGIVHNLRNPLAGMFGRTELLQARLNELRPRLNEDKLAARLIDRIDSDANQIAEETLRLEQLVASLMAKSRSDNTTSAEPFDLNDLLRQELAFLEANHDFSHRVNVDVKLTGALPVHAVRSEIAQVLQNLVRNALDALWRTENPFMVISSGRRGKVVWFEVADNGPGIPTDNVERLFDPFFTTKPSEERAAENEPIGTGLGLHSCLQLIKANQGDIKPSNGEMGGAVFRVELPLIKESESVPLPESGENHHPHSTERTVS